MKKKVQTKDAPAPIGPYSQAVIAGGFLFVSGQIPLDPKTGELVGGSVEDQTQRVFENLGAILKEAKLTFDNVVKATVFLADMKDFAAMNEVYATYFEAPYPARTTIQAGALPAGIAVEIECVARA